MNKIKLISLLAAAAVMTGSVAMAGPIRRRATAITAR